MQPGSQKLQSELNTVEDAAGDERFSMPTTIFHHQVPGNFGANLAASPMVCNYGKVITNSASHALRVSEASV